MSATEPNMKISDSDRKSVVIAAHDIYRLSQELAFVTAGRYKLHGAVVDFRRVHEAAAKATGKLLIGAVEQLNAADSAALSLVAFGAHSVLTDGEQIRTDYIKRRTNVSEMHTYHQNPSKLLHDFSMTANSCFAALDTFMPQNWRGRSAIVGSMRQLGL